MAVHVDTKLIVCLGLVGVDPYTADVVAFVEDHNLVTLPSRDKTSSATRKCCLYNNCKDEQVEEKAAADKLLTYLANALTSGDKACVHAQS